MSRTRVDGIISAFVILSLAQSAFAGSKFADYPPRKAGECPIKANKSGLVVGIQPVEDLKDQRNYFSSDLKQKGFVPVYIVIENQSAEDSFLFDKTAVKMGVGAAPGAGPNASSKTAETVEVVSVVAISPIGIIIGLKLLKDEASVQTNLLKKEVQSKTLSPGASTSGFLYLPVPKNGPRQPILLKISVTRSGDDEPIGLDFNF